MFLHCNCHCAGVLSRTSQTIVCMKDTERILTIYTNPKTPLNPFPIVFGIQYDLLYGWDTFSGFSATRFLYIATILIAYS